MRTGGCTVQQALTPEAASVVKQAVTLARRRGHAQVTPLHVANTMLSASTGLLRTACLQSHNHPLQCRALELCFNVALNRLPASTSAPMQQLGGPHHHHQQLPQYPSISNALVAAFKRAQAHQRRGSVETQQQPLLAVKIELDQLIISILDDPSVSRVMREAGFSSTQVKSNVEQAVSLEICSQQTTTADTKDNKLVVAVHGEEDVRSVIENLVSRRGVAIVGESLGTAEGVVKGVMERVEKGEVPEVLRRVKLVSVPPNFGDELKGVVRGYMEKGGVVVNLGDLKWAADDDGGRSRMEQLVMDLGKLSCNDELGRLWMVGVATFQTYTKCKSTVESVWGLHPVTIPAGILRLTLLTTTDSELQSQSTVNINNSGKGENAGRSSSSWINIIPGAGEEEAKQRLNYGCGTDCCSGKLENEENKNNGTSSCCNSCDSPTSSTLPAWLRPYKSHNHQDSVSIKDLCKKWNSSPDLQITSHHHHHDYHTTNTRMRGLTFASLVSPSHSPSTSISSYLDPTSFRHHQPPWRSSTTTTSPSLDPILHHHHNFWPTKTLTLPIDHLHSHGPSTVGPALRVFIPDYPNNKQNPPPFFSSNPNSLSTTPNSTSSSDNTTTDYSTHRFNSLNSDNLKALCTAMETKVPRQRHVIPDIATTILQCRSGMVSRRRSKEDTWLFFQGADVEAKEAIAKEIARLVFGSHHSLLSISLSNFSSAEDYTHSSSRSSCKRGRPEDEKSYVERFAEAVGRDPHRVFFVEDVEQADYCSQVGFKRAMESGKVTRRNSSGDEDEEVRLGDAIVILSCEGSFSCRSSRACSPTSKHKINNEGRAVKEVGDDDDDDEKMEEGESPCLSLDLNICIEDDDEVQSIDDIGILELVDRRIVFKLPREEDQL
ncbi:unnamed protein product [Linum trigynum]|uniref:Clp R domain-containing protein n=1 Tax=Linum trigynum TaxID=586398 RepID=A0AAV2F9M7_9ROSI